MPKPGYHTIELNKTEWEVPQKYTMLSPVGSGAYGQVWWASNFFLTFHSVFSSWRPFSTYFYPFRFVFSWSRPAFTFILWKETGILALCCVCVCVYSFAHLIIETIALYKSKFV